MVNEERARSEMLAAAPVSEDPHPTPMSAVAAPKVNEVDERVDRLLAENLELMKERRRLIEVADERSNRSTQLLDEVRTARRLLRKLFGQGPHINVVLDDKVLGEIRAWLDRPL